MPASVKVFIGWSGPRSKAVATAFAEWLRLVVQASDPWVSEDMDRGAKWFATIGESLKNADYGLLCVTPENVSQAWVLFEAGALAMQTSEHDPNGRLACPYLLDMAPSDLEPPLGQLQAATADKEGTWKVVETINGLVDEGVRLPGHMLHQLFDTMWQQLEAKLDAARKIVTAPVAPARPVTDMVAEILDIVRELQRAEASRPSSLEAARSAAFSDALGRALGVEPQPTTRAPGDSLPQDIRRMSLRDYVAAGRFFATPQASTTGPPPRKVRDMIGEPPKPDTEPPKPDATT